MRLFPALITSLTLYTEQVRERVFQRAQFECVLGYRLSWQVLTVLEAKGEIVYYLGPDPIFQVLTSLSYIWSICIRRCVVLVRLLVLLTDTSIMNLPQTIC